MKQRVVQYQGYHISMHTRLNLHRPHRTHYRTTLELTISLSGCAGGGDVWQQPDQHLAGPHPRQVQASRRGGDGVLRHCAAQRFSSR
jgi:hypothetical protein